MKNKSLIFVLSIILLSIKTQATLYQDMSDFEQEAVDQAMAFYGLSPELSPDNKNINNIFIYTQEPFSKHSGFLSWFDKLHVNTKNSVINRYLLFKKNDHYDAQRIKDSEFYLRRFSHIRSLAVVVPVKSADQRKGTLDILVVTRDILSLRPSFNIDAIGKIITDLSFSLGEYNLLGLNKTLSMGYSYKQAYNLFSSCYFDPLFLGSQFELLIKPSLILAHETLFYEGFLGELELKRPLISRYDKWGFSFSTAFGAKPVIDFKGDKIRQVLLLDVANGRKIERRYRWRFGQGRLLFRRSFGLENKKELFFGYGINLKKPLIPKDLDLTQAEEASFKKNVLPRDELESFLILGASYFQDRYLTLYGYNNFQLQETKRLGPFVSLSGELASRDLLFSDHNFIRPDFRFSFTHQIYRDSFFNFSFYGETRFDGSWSDNMLKGGLSIVSPLWPKVGRLVVDSNLAAVFNNRDNTKFVLGAESGIRGVTSRYYLGDKAFRANVEFRSSSYKLWLVYVGGVLFYDVGSAYNKIKDANATHSLGFGLRILAPQISSQLFRIDLGFPIYGRGQKHNVVIPTFGIGQAF